MYTQEELLNALHEAGAGGHPFTLGAVRARLGLSSHDKHELDRFRRRVRSLQKASGGQLERVGNNSYRLKIAAEEAAANDVAVETVPQGAELPRQASAFASPQPTAAGEKATQSGLCARGLALGQRVALFLGEQYAHRHEHAERLRELKREWQPKAEALRAVGLLQLQALRQRVAAVRRHTA